MGLCVWFFSSQLLLGLVVGACAFAGAAVFIALVSLKAVEPSTLV